MKNDVRVAISTDEAGFAINATLIASILRRTDRAVHVRCWCRGFSPESFEKGQLKVEFLPAEDEVTGRYPTKSGPAAYDRLLVIRDCPDWDRCMVMDYDQLVLCDLGPLFDMDLGDHLLAAHMQGTGVDMAYAMRVWLKRPLPEGWEHVASHPYFLMPPLLNLKAMREAGTWDVFTKAHAAFGADEQLSLTAATEGRSLPLEAKWNLFPRLHIPAGVVPEGIIHWSGWPKPWHRNAKVWRPDVWEAERSSWEHLRMGIWEKPLAVEVDPIDGRSARALWARGWSVKVWPTPGSAPGLIDSEQPPGADLAIEPGNLHGFRTFLEDRHQDVEMVRFGPWCDPGEWLDGCRKLPGYVVLTGERSEAELERVRQWGYEMETSIKPVEWPAGGPLPKVLEYQLNGDSDGGLPSGNCLYLKRTRDASIEGGLQAGPRPELPMEAKGSDAIAVAVIAVGRRRGFLQTFLRSAERNFLPGHPRRWVVFTDAEMEEWSAPERHVVRVTEDALGQKELGCYSILNENWHAFDGADFVFLLDTRAVVEGLVGREMLGDGLTAVTHAGFHGKPRSAFTYEPREASTACVRGWEGGSYYTGAVQGGKSEVFRNAVEKLSSAVESDRTNGIAAVWGAESHWNRILVDQPPAVALPPSHGRPEWQTPEFPLLISLRSERK
jgi:lipopolysaccharide biosynthesis glycosyltransferase